MLLIVVSNLLPLQLTETRRRIPARTTTVDVVPVFLSQLSHQWLVKASLHRRKIPSLRDWTVKGLLHSIYTACWYGLLGFKHDYLLIAQGVLIRWARAREHGD